MRDTPILGPTKHSQGWTQKHAQWFPLKKFPKEPENINFISSKTSYNGSLKTVCSAWFAASTLQYNVAFIDHYIIQC
jgi:hypothetical protein